MVSNIGRWHSLPLMLGLILLIAQLSASNPAGAEGPEDGGELWPDGRKPVTTVDTQVDSRPDGVYIQISVHQTVAGTTGNEQPGQANYHPAVEGQPTASSAAGSTAAQGRSWSDDDGLHYETADGHLITLKLLPNIKAGIADGMVGQIGQRPGEFPYLLITDGQFQGVIWIGAGTPSDIHFGPPPAAAPAPGPLPAGGGGVIDPYAIALQVLGQVPLPAIEVKTNPDLGLVALPGWFWVDGYDGRPFGASRTVTLPPPPGGTCPCPTITVSVQVWAGHYEWSFGDGASRVTNSLGRRYPQESDIQHTYEYSSLGSPEGFPVDVTVEFAAEYRVDGGAPQPLPPIIRIYHRAYRVQEVQAVLTGR